MSRGMNWTQEQLDAFEKRTGVKIVSAPEPKKNKYGAKKTVFNGRKYDSAKEAARAEELQMMQKVGAIFELRQQVRFPLLVNGEHVCDYIADFVYATHGGPDQNYLTEVVEDVKSAYTRKLPVYRLKKKLMHAIHNIEIKEV